MKIKCLFLTAILLAISSIGFAQSKSKTTTKEIAPNVVVKNLYAAQKSGSGPFFQTKNRAVVDKYFTKKLADLIWNDAVAAKGEVGAIDFDPLYGSQDPQITKFRIMDVGWGGDDSKFGRDDEAVVQVTFDDSGTEQMVSFEFIQGKDKSWKLYDIRYRNDSRKLVEILSEAAGAARVVDIGDALSITEHFTVGGKLQIGATESVILYLGKKSGDYAAYCFTNNSAAGRAILAKCKEGKQCEVVGEVETSGECKVPELEAALSASGKINKVNSVKLVADKAGATIPRKN